MRISASIIQQYVNLCSPKLIKPYGSMALPIVIVCGAYEIYQSKLLQPACRLSVSPVLSLQDGAANERRGGSHGGGEAWRWLQAVHRKAQQGEIFQKIWISGAKLSDL